MDQSKKTPPFPPYLAIGFGILAVSTASIFIRFAQAEVSSIVIAAYRLMIAALVLTFPALHRYQVELKRLSRRDLALGFFSGVFLALHFATWISSLEYTSVASSVVLVTTTPLWVSLMAPVTIKESITKQVVFGMLVSLLGTVVIGLVDICDQGGAFACPPLREFIQAQTFLGDFLALAGALTAAGYILIGRNLRAKLSLIPYIFVVYGIAAVILTIMAVSSGENLTGFSSESYLWLVLLALIPQLLGHSSFNWALGYLPAAFVSITLLGEPIGTTILAAIFLKEVPGPIKLFGAILILGGILIASLQPSKISGERTSSPSQ
ncbi:MAG: DMT family transporter [Anaerolineae bacterium]|nr:DMT family transporter [Anaerolineae bacterium]